MRAVVKDAQRFAADAVDGMVASASASSEQLRGTIADAHRRWRYAEAVYQALLRWWSGPGPPEARMPEVCW